MNFLDEKRIQIKEKKSTGNINFFSDINLKEYSITSNMSYDIEINKDLEDVFHFNQELNISEDINGKYVYFKDKGKDKIFKIKIMKKKQI